ncbi:RNA-directed DNA polymerase from transposon x-element-like protein-related [Anaeramoeba ignava]|uniref:RNA-directed DNA polymerase from transposon x-element-like protein-related n=1 Tax=Anaeramoeba ignava TaxID=1746090 RepID=A0A9Q0L858_ANAIG|nr:RNA-directed DNA polymerase from transposon x-element-like protein-related [Anaeramoeba ignava]
MSLNFIIRLIDNYGQYERTNQEHFLVEEPRKAAKERRRAIRNGTKISISISISNHFKRIINGKLISVNSYSNLLTILTWKTYWDYNTLPKRNIQEFQNEIIKYIQERRMIFIYKQGNPEEIKNYRPISINNSTARFFLKRILEEIEHVWEKNQFKTNWI